MTLPNNQTRIELYRKLIEISRDLVSTLDRNDLLLRIVNAAVDLCDAEAASILLYDETQQELHFEVTTNIEKQSMRVLNIPIDSSIAGWIVTNKQSVIINDTQTDDRHFEHVGQSLQMKIRSLIGVPLIAKDKVIGVVETINKNHGEFNDEDLDLLTALSTLAAIAIENSRLFQQSDLISELVHELRTPMASLNTAIHLLIRKDIEETQRLYLINMIQSEISRLSELTTSFLDLARLESGRVQFNPESLSLDQILSDCTEMMRARAVEKELELITHFQSNLPKVQIDADKMKQVIINLLSNAIKYNYPGGQIEITSFINGENLGFSIQDTGPGISEADMTHLFEKFYRVPGTEKLASGTGLGLSICKRIIDAHQGSIHVDSIVGRGTKFTVNLPL